MVRHNVMKMNETAILSREQLYFPQGKIIFIVKGIFKPICDMLHQQLYICSHESGY